MALIFFASSVPGDEITIHVWDKLLHLTVYAALGVCFLIPMADGRWANVGIKSAALAVALSLLYGMVDEFHQSFTPDRTPDAMDLLADALGASIGVTAIVLLRALDRRLRPRRQLRT
jgi:VanZ family protein